MPSTAQLGIIDWGIGGVGIYKRVKERYGDVPVIYFSDTGITPYGKMSRRELVTRLNDVVGFLGCRGVTHLMIGCNAASTAIPFIDPQGLKIEGVIETAVETAARHQPKNLGLIGGRRTVLSGVYQKAFAERGINVKQRIAQPLSGLIESGDISSDNLRGECRRIMTPLKNCSHILLACTHYPVITDVLKDFVSTQTTFIDPSKTLVEKVRTWGLRSSGTDEFLTSGDEEQMKRAAVIAYGVEIPDVRNVSGLVRKPEVSEP